MVTNSAMNCIREHRRLVFLAILTLSAISVPGWAETGRKTVTDPTGRTVQVPESARRIVALAPSITEMVYALKLEDRLVGVTRFSNYPAAAQKLPKVGTYIQLDVERIVALRPDLVIAIKDGNPLSAVEHLQAMGLPVYAVDPVDLEGVMQSMLALGDLLGAAAQATAVVDDMRARIARVQSHLSGIEHKPKVFIQIGVSPIVSAGSNTFIDKLITLAGGDNAAAGTLPYPRFSREQVIALAPEVIVITSMERSAIYDRVRDEWMQWPGIPAVRNKAVHIAPSDLFDRPSPRLVDALELLTGYIHPRLSRQGP
jgi:iron complex transport system substrate-binding protein